MFFIDHALDLRGKPILSKRVAPNRIAREESTAPACSWSAALVTTLDFLSRMSQNGNFVKFKNIHVACFALKACQFSQLNVIRCKFYRLDLQGKFILSTRVAFRNRTKRFTTAFRVKGEKMTVMVPSVWLPAATNRLLRFFLTHVFELYVGRPQALTAQSSLPQTHLCLARDLLLRRGWTTNRCYFCWLVGWLVGCLFSEIRLQYLLRCGSQDEADATRTSHGVIMHVDNTAFHISLCCRVDPSVSTIIWNVGGIWMCGSLCSFESFMSCTSS